MKRTGRYLVLILALVLLQLSAALQNAAARPQAGFSYQLFYDELSPYGQWVEDAQYGFVWVPRVEADFRPYFTRGYWVMSNYGNTWYSEYPWGWAAFHYGRWTYDPYYGWIWIPGREWAPAWVCWRSGFGYYGWAPLSPGFSISISFDSYWCPSNWWIFIPPHHIHDHHFHQHWNGPRRNEEIIHHTTVINTTQAGSDEHHRFPVGPDRNEIEAATGQPLSQYNVVDQIRPDKSVLMGTTLGIFRPEMDGAATARPATSIRAPQTIEKPAPVGEPGQQPEFRNIRPDRNDPISTERAPESIPVQKPLRDRQESPRPQLPVRGEARPARPNSDEIYREQPVLRPVPQGDQPRIERKPPQAQPVERSKPAPEQRRPATLMTPQRPAQAPVERQPQAERQRPSR